MIIKGAEKDSAIVSGFAGNGQFSIKASAKAFKILSDNIYTNKIAAIIRELSTNALDSHFDAKTDRKFEVQLPSYLESIFKIRDFGTGLSHENVMKLYTTYFESTKDKSNDYNGTLGLGSKAPFSYTKTFNVTSYFNGKKSFYTAYISNDDTPSILHAGDQDTDEPNGLEISFPVENKDISAFLNSAQEIYYWFEQKPKIIGADEKSILNVNKSQYSKKEFTFENVTIYSGQNSYHNNSYKKAIVTQGNIAYPINIDILSGVCELETYEKEFLNKTVIIAAPIGSVNFAPSREELNYDETTVSYIRERIKATYDNLVSKIDSELKGISTKWERAKTYSKKYEYGNPLHFESISTEVDMFSEKDIKVPLGGSIYFYTNSNKRPSLRLWNSTDNQDVVPTYIPTLRLDEIKFYVYNKKIGGITAFEDMRYAEIMADAYSFKRWHDIYIFGDKEATEKILNMFGNPPYENMDNKYSKIKKKETTAKMITTSEIAKGKIGNWENMTDDIEDLTGHFMYVNDFSSLGSSKENWGFYHGPRTIVDVVKKLTSFDIPENCILIREKDKDKVEKNPNLIHYTKNIHEMLMKMENTPSYKEALDDLSYHDRNIVFMVKKTSKLAETDLYKIANSSMTTDTKDIRNAKAAASYMERYLNHNSNTNKSYYSILKENNTKRFEIRDAMKEINETYPLLKFITQLGNDSKELLEYIDIMNEYNSNKKENENGNS